MSSNYQKLLNNLEALNGYCGRFLPPLRSFVPVIASECTSCCETAYHLRQNLMKPRVSLWFHELYL